MEELLYQLFITFLSAFIIWAVWFGIAYSRKNKKQMLNATVTCVTIFAAKAFGVIVALAMLIGYYAAKKILFPEKHDGEESDQTEEKDDDNGSENG